MKDIIIYIVLGLGLSSSFAETYYVDIQGNNNSSGKIDTPWATVQHAINQAIAGDSIFVRDGIYTETLRMNVTSGKKDAPIVLQNFPDEHVKIQSATASGGDPALQIRVNYVEIRGMTIHKLTQSSGPIRIYSGQHILLDSLEVIGPGSWDNIGISNEYGETGYVTIRNCKIHTALHEAIYIKSVNEYPLHHFVIENNEIYNCPDEAVQISASPYPDNPPTDVLIKSNNIHHVGAWAIIHLYYAPQNVVIDGNFIHHNTSPWVGIHLDGAEAIIKNNVFSHNSGSQSGQDYANIRISDSHGTPKFQILNNTFGITTRGEAPNAYGIWIGDGACSQTDTISNNIFYEIEDGAIYYHGEPENQTNYNIFYHSNNGPAIIISYHQTIDYSSINEWNNNNRFIKPLFIDPENLNYELDVSSPAIDSGINLNVKTDITGYFRALSNQPDIGAFEYKRELILKAPNNIRINHK